MQKNAQLIKGESIKIKSINGETIKIESINNELIKVEFINSEFIKIPLTKAKLISHEVHLTSLLRVMTVQMISFLESLWALY